MPNPSNTTRRAEARNIETLHSRLPQSPALAQSQTARSPYLSPLQKQQERSPQPEAHQLNLLALLEKPQQPALRTEAIPVHLTVGTDERFWLIHQESGLRVPGQFSCHEAKYIQEATREWSWAVDPKTREPACRWRLLCLLEQICSPQSAQGVAA